MKLFYNKIYCYLQNKSSFLFDLLQWLLLIFLVVLYIYFQCTNIISDFDSAAELILGNLLAKEHTILTPNFYYSTEINIFSYNITNAFFFLIFESWKNVQIANNITWVFLLLSGYYIICKSLNCTKYFPITACLFLIPYTPDNAINLLSNTYYIQPILFEFLSVSLILSNQNFNSKIKKILFIFLLIIVSFMNGIQGFRPFVLTYFPLFLTGIFIIYNRIKNFYTFIPPIIIQFVTSFVALIINRLLYLKIPCAVTYSNIQWTNGFGNDFIINIECLINNILVGFGYYPDDILSLNSVKNVIILSLMFLFFKYTFKKLKEKDYNDVSYFLVLYTFICILIFCIICIFSNIESQPRYFYQIVFFIVPILCLYLIKNKKFKSILIISIIILIINNANFYLSKYYGNDSGNTKQQMTFVNYLLENDYKSGYASFPHSNILTYLTNNQIQMYNLNFLEKYDENKTLDFKSDLMKIGQLVSHTSEIPSGKIFLLLTQDEYNQIPVFKKAANKEILRSDIYLVLGFENYNEMKTLLK